VPQSVLRHVYELSEAPLDARTAPESKRGVIRWHGGLPGGPGQAERYQPTPRAHLGLKIAPEGYTPIAGGLGNPKAGGQGSRQKPIEQPHGAWPQAQPRRSPSVPQLSQRSTAHKPQAARPHPSPSPKAITAAASSQKPPKPQNPNFADSKPGNRPRWNRAEANRGGRQEGLRGFSPSTGFLETLRQGSAGLEIKTGFASQNSLCYRRPPGFE